LLNGLFAGASTYIELQTRWFEHLAFAVGFIVFAVLFAVWSGVGIWRSANRSIERARTKVPKDSTRWAYAAQVMVVLSAMRAIAEWIPVAEDLASIMEVADSDIAKQYYVELIGETDVVLNGYINKNSVQDVIDAFSDRRRNVLILNSRGGLLTNAFELADYVRRHGIFTVTERQCISSCLLVLAAADKAITTSDAILVFHDPEPTAEFRTSGLQETFEGEKQAYYDRFRSYGVPVEKLEALRTAGYKQLTLAEAYDAYLIDLIWHKDTNEFEEVQDYCDRIGGCQ
jgi:hypothetical protein